MADIAREIMAQNLKIDEVSSTWFDAKGEGTHAEFDPESDGQRKGDTIYVPGTLDLDNIAHVSTLLHELQHAATRPVAVPIRVTSAAWIWRWRPMSASRATCWRSCRS